VTAPPGLPTAPRTRGPETALRLLLLLVLLFLFLVAIDLMSGAFKAMGRDTAEGLFRGVANPFAGLAVGVLATVLVQSSSVTTSTIVALVGSGQLSVEHAVPMVMGANIGTTITNTLVSIGSIRQTADFRRAFAAATMHDFFNLLVVVVLLPAELATGLLHRGAAWLTGEVTVGGGAGGGYHSPIKTAVKAVASRIEDGLLAVTGLEGNGAAALFVVVSLVLIVLCLTTITKNMRRVIAASAERALNAVLGRSQLLGIAVGILMTVAVQSSSITTSLLVPLCAAGILTLENAFPVTLGANIGTTVTALLASLATDVHGLTIALVHLLFNVTGTVLVLAIPGARAIPIRLARSLADRAVRNPLWVLFYVGTVFVLVPLLGIVLFR